MSEQKPTTIADLKAAFYDHQRQQANVMEGLVGEIVRLNQVCASLQSQIPEPADPIPG